MEYPLLPKLRKLQDFFLDFDRHLFLFCSHVEMIA